MVGCRGFLGIGVLHRKLCKKQEKTHDALLAFGGVNSSHRRILGLSVLELFRHPLIICPGFIRRGVGDK